MQASVYSNEVKQARAKQRTTLDAITFGVVTARGTAERTRRSERMNAMLPMWRGRAHEVTMLERVSGKSHLPGEA